MTVIATLFLLQVKAKEPEFDVLAKPTALAKSSNRYVFAIFSATWCRSCKDLKTMIEKPSFAKVFNTKFVTTYIDVSDSHQVKNLMLRTRYCSDKAPMPAYAIIDGNGKLIANSFGNSTDRRHPSVLSYPLSRSNIGDFLRMLNKVPNGLATDTLWKLRAELEKSL